jgi:hypothetical protein
MVMEHGLLYQGKHEGLKRIRYRGEYLGLRGIRMRNGEGLYNEELHSLYRLPNIVTVIKFRRLRWAVHVARMEEDRTAFKILTGKLKGRCRRRWEENIKMDLKLIGLNTRDRVDSAQDSFLQP